MNIDVAPPAQPAHLDRLPLPMGAALIYRHASEIALEIWARGFGESAKDFAYYDLLETTMCSHFDYRYLLLLDESNRPLALQPLIIVAQDLAASAGAKLSSIFARLRRRWPRFFRSRMLLAGCLVGEGRLGLLDSSPPEEISFRVAEALEHFARREKIGLIAFKDFPVATRAAFSKLKSAGYGRLSGFPSLALDFDFDSFEQYMSVRLSKATRKNLRRKFRNADDATPELKMEVTSDAEQIIDEIYPLYLAVAQQSEIRFEIFTREYFLEAGRRMPGRFRYFLWRQDGRAVAFSFCTIWRDTIYDNDIGLDYAVAHELNLYYVTFRDLVSWALENGLRRYASAPFNYDPKLHLRLELQPVDLYVRHTSAVLNPLVQTFARLFEPARTDPVLRRHLESLR